MKVQNYQDLLVWQKAMKLVLAVYEVTKSFPSTEVSGLTSQMRRASVSIPSNIAEGSRRGTRKDFRSFLLRSFASGAELETQFEIAQNLEYISLDQAEKAKSLLDEVMRMLNVLIKKLKEQTSVPEGSS